MSYYNGENYVYMLIDNHSKYKLPIYVAETADELARVAGVKAQTIYACISRSQKTNDQNPRYIKIVLEEEEDDKQGSN